MLQKVTFLLCWALLLESAIADEDLNIYMNKTDTKIREIEAEGEVTISSYSEALSKMIQDANIDIAIVKLTEQAKPYWSAIAELEAEAEANAQNISSCTKQSMEEFFKLNNTVVNAPLKIINAYGTRGKFVCVNSTNAIRKVLDGLEPLQEKVNTCSDTQCETELFDEIELFYNSSLSTIQEAVGNAEYYVTEELPTILNETSLDLDYYLANIEAIVEETKACISYLH